MGRASNRKWAKRRARILDLATSKMPSAIAEAARLLKRFGAQRPFLRIQAAQVRRRMAATKAAAFEQRLRRALQRGIRVESPKG